MLKPYFDRDTSSSERVCPVVVVTEASDPDNSDSQSDVHVPEIMPKLNNSEILKNFKGKVSHLPENYQQCLTQLFLKFAKLFPDVPTQTDVLVHDIDVGEAQPVKQAPYRLNPAKKQVLHDEVQYLLANNLIKPSRSNWCSPCVLVLKQDGTYRLCVDYRKVNSVTKTDTFPIPRIEDCIDNVGKAHFVTKFDLLQGFWQVPLSDRAKEISAFVTPDGLYQFNVMPFGLKNAPATFQRLINNVISGLKGCEAYIDDIVLYSDSWEDHLQLLQNFFERLGNAKLTVNLSKSQIVCGSVTYLGHIVGQGKVKPIHSKIDAICRFPFPDTRKQLMCFLGMVGYYRKFCQNFSTITEPLTHLLRRDVKFVW